MRTCVTLIIFSLIYTSLSYGQCIPDPKYTQPGIYPDSATGLPPAVATYEYNAVFTAVIPADTIVSPFPVMTIDSIGVALITGLPEGFQAIPNRPSGYWPGGTSGCMLITGNPTESQTGVYPLSITVVGYMGGLGLPFPYEITYYSLTILPASAYGIDDKVNALRLQAFPNPFTGMISLTFYAREKGIYSCRILDATGRLLQTQTLDVIPGENTGLVDGSTLAPGIYFCALSRKDGKDFSIIRLIKP
ncbi:hypothetical protein DSECCO2_532870 [anaerobic digester metagenome]